MWINKNNSVLVYLVTKYRLPPNIFRVLHITRPVFCHCYQLILTDNPIVALQQYFLGHVPVSAGHSCLQPPVMTPVQVRKDSVAIGNWCTTLLALRRSVGALEPHNSNITIADAHQWANNA